MNATANARRVALCHIAFNLITAIVALATLPLFVWGVAEIGSRIGIENHPAPFLALFHTAFNLLGIILLLPFARQISRISANLFLSQEEILSHPKYLDNTVSHAPELAIAALWSELERLYELSCELVLISLSEKRMTERKIEKRAEAIFSLGAAINEFATNLRMENLAREHSEELPATIKSARYLEEVARQTNNLYSLANSSQELKNEEIKELLEEYLRVTTDTVRVFAKFEFEPDVGEKKLRALTAFQTSYQETKEGFLQVTIRKHLSIDQVDNLLDRLSRSRRLVEQLIKADRSIHQIRYPNVENIVQ